MPDSVAERFVAARRNARALSGYPGAIPEHLSEAYAIQDEAIVLWNRPIVGWKIGRIAPEKQALYSAERLAGPIFDNVFKLAGKEVEVPVFEGGFAAVEAEFVFRVGVDADPAQTGYNESEALALLDGMFAGIEMAGSPLASINALGPSVVISDFGNNFGLILGPQLLTLNAEMPIVDFQPDRLTAWRATPQIDDQIVGEGGLFTMPGGPLKAVAWLAGHLAERKHPLRKGQFISSGATTGIHDIKAGQTSRVRFEPSGQSAPVIALRAIKATQGCKEVN